MEVSAFLGVEIQYVFIRNHSKNNAVQVTSADFVNFSIKYEKGLHNHLRNGGQCILRGWRIALEKI